MIVLNTNNKYNYYINNFLFDICDKIDNNTLKKYILDKYLPNNFGMMVLNNINKYDYYIDNFFSDICTRINNKKLKKYIVNKYLPNNFEIIVIAISLNPNITPLIFSI